MTPLLYGLGQRCVRHRLPVLAVWLVVLVALALAARAVGPNVNDNLTLPGSDSQQATDLLEQRFPSQANATGDIALTMISAAEVMTRPACATAGADEASWARASRSRNHSWPRARPRRPTRSAPTTSSRSARATSAAARRRSSSRRAGTGSGAGTAARRARDHQRAAAGPAD